MTKKRKKYEKHGLTKHKLKPVHNAMVERCHNPNRKDYKYYGAKGIKVCDEWRNSVKNFIDWAELNGWHEGLEIDRDDNEAGYTPENCQFITKADNCLNRSNSKLWIVHGIEYSYLSDVAKAFGVHESTIRKWCDGYAVKGYKYPPKDGCWSEKKYSNSNMRDF